jgi:cell wall-associated NlpC family hydrolase
MILFTGIIANIVIIRRASMKRYTQHIAFVLLVAVFTTLFMPAVPAKAFSLADLTGSTSQSGNSSGLWNILLALLLGKVLGTSNSSDLSSGLGSVLGPKTTDGGSAKAAEIIKNAQKYMGVPYVWGGDTPSGWDCSGYTHFWIERKFGENAKEARRFVSPP